MAPFLFLHHYMDATAFPGKGNRKMHFGEFRLLFWQETKMYLRKKATLIGVFGKSGCLFTETQVASI